MYVIVKKYKIQSTKSTYVWILLTINILNVLSYVFCAVITFMISESIGFGTSFIQFFSKFVGNIIMFLITIVLSVVLSSLGLLSAYKYNKNFEAEKGLIFEQTEETTETQSPNQNVENN